MLSKLAQISWLTACDYTAVVLAQYCNTPQSGLLDSAVMSPLLNNRLLSRIFCLPLCKVKTHCPSLFMSHLRFSPKLWWKKFFSKTLHINSLLWHSVFTLLGLWFHRQVVKNKFRFTLAAWHKAERWRIRAGKLVWQRSDWSAGREPLWPQLEGKMTRLKKSCTLDPPNTDLDRPYSPTSAWRSCG